MYTLVTRFTFETELLKYVSKNVLNVMRQKLDNGVLRLFSRSTYRP